MFFDMHVCIVLISNTVMLCITVRYPTVPTVCACKEVKNYGNHMI